MLGQWLLRKKASCNEDLKQVIHRDASVPIFLVNFMPKWAARGEISEIISMSKNVIDVHTVLKFNFFETQLLFNTVNYVLEVFHRKHMLASHLCQIQPLIVCSLF